MRLAWVLRQQDTRTLATRWIDANLPPAASIVCWSADPAGIACPHLHRVQRGGGQLGDAQYAVRASYPAPFMTAPDLPNASAERLAVFDPFPGAEAAPVVERMDFFYLPLARFAGVTHPGPLIEIFRLRRDT